MGWLLLLALGLWFGGARLGASVRARATVLGVLYAAIVAGQFALPQGNPVRIALGGGPAPWLMLGAVIALVLLYRKGLSALRTRAEPAQPDTPAPLFSDSELNRYARHIVLRELGGPGQKALKQAKVLVIGAGGLGSPALLYLAAAGVGTIGVIDDDSVDNSNLQRQVIHRDADIDTPKVHSAARAMRAQNPFVTVLPYQRRLSAEIAADLFAEYDVILDGTDNFDTRYLANRGAVAAGKPLISGALSQWEGQLSVFSPRRGAPCYECIFPTAPAPGLAPSCSEAGVLSPLPGVLGSMMAVEAVKLITGAGAPLLGEMLIYDALWGETRKIAMKPRPDCPVCGALHEVTQ
ncbi:HesA/MoeB/ThiF family protein [Pseudooceanicola spongiae]|uniref:Molybdopterin-synthase adenylyltransferase n=1 Tax=Pseudooceanicola spongiae TaxID=2613965 RepID=A0A7L9WMR4_9RHOB|nr:molybdopterin-synthase adenylyltransferase MoeB [Pseudooceanicola spongiae]QOL81223.1 molybdopterin-synthase adenylyltransferase MoeB [Pseudooceanicola spongiae]